MSEEEQMDGPELVSDLTMAEFELMLARAMARVDAPEGFATRVMEKAGQKQTVITMRPRNGLWRMQAWMGGAIAAALAVGMYGAEVLHQRREQAKADQQFAVAMQVTDHALAQTREQLQRAGLKLGQ